MSRFQAGALVVYGNLGVHEVEAVGLRRFCDEPAREYYTLRPYFSDSHDRSYIPTAKEDALRPVTPAQQAAADLARIKAEELPIPAGVQPALAEHYKVCDPSAYGKIRMRNFIAYIGSLLLFVERKRSMNENKMGTVPVNKLLVSMATPMVLSMLVGALYNVVDSLFVSHYGENALSAVSYVLGNAIGIYGIWWSFLISETVTVVFALLHLAGTEKRELERIAPVL